jgi:hypothetical protein
MNDDNVEGCDSGGAEQAKNFCGAKLLERLFFVCKDFLTETNPYYHFTGSKRT